MQENWRFYVGYLLESIYRIYLTDTQKVKKISTIDLYFGERGGRIGEEMPEIDSVSLFTTTLEITH